MISARSQPCLPACSTFIQQRELNTQRRRDTTAQDWRDRGRYINGSPELAWPDCGHFRTSIEGSSPFIFRVRFANRVVTQIDGTRKVAHGSVTSSCHSSSRTLPGSYQTLRSCTSDGGPEHFESVQLYLRFAMPELHSALWWQSVGRPGKRCQLSRSGATCYTRSVLSP